jgi:DNA-binding NarL/FixJ family response regulator
LYQPCEALRLGGEVMLQADARTQLCASTATRAAAEEALLHWKPQVLLAALEVPPGPSVAWMHQLGRVYPAVGVVAWGELTDVVVARLLEAGVRAVLPREVEAAELHRAIHTVAVGGAHANGWLRRQWGAVRGRKVVVLDAAGPDLTQRERQVLRLLCHPHGYTLAEVAARMGIALSTVQYHRNRIYAKLQVRNRAALVHAARAHGLPEPDRTDG